MRKLLPVFLVLLLSTLVGKKSYAQCDTTMLANDSLQWVFVTGYYPAEVKDMERLNDTLYLGGTFEYVGKYTGYFAGVDTTSGRIVQHGSWPKVNGPVYASVPDGNGGFIIAGSFFQVGDSARRNIARITASGTVDAFNPGTDDTVYSMALNNGTLYIGGAFSAAAGSTRNRLAAITLSTGVATSWNPGSNGTVHAIATDGSTVFAGGRFTTVASASRKNIAAIDISSGTATSFNPGAGTTDAHIVLSIVLTTDRVYVGGSFNNIGGQARSNIAACVKSSGTVTSWAPNANSRVNTMLLTRNILYTGGDFSSIGGKSRRRLAAIDTATGSANNWSPFQTVSNNRDVYSLALIDKTLYVGGDFRMTQNSLQRSHIAAIDTSGTGNLRSLSKYPNQFGIIHTIQPSGVNVFLGGTFVSLEGADQAGLAAIDIRNNKLLPLNPDIFGGVADLEISDNKLYVAGVSSVNGFARKHLASFDIANNYSLTSWNPLDVPGITSINVIAMTIFGDYAYVAGNFDFTSNGRHIDAAKIHKTTGAVDAWAPYAGSATGYGATKDGTNVYLGSFLSNHSGGSSIVMQYTPSTNTTIHHPLSGNVWAMKAYHNKILCAGYMTDGVLIRRYASSLYPGGKVTTWAPTFNMDPFSYSRIFNVTGYRDLSLVTGLFDTADQERRLGFAVMDTAVGRVYGAWNPRFTYGETGVPRMLNAMVWGGDTVFIVGQNSHVAGKSIFSFARFHVKYEAPSVTITVDDDSVCDGTPVVVRATQLKDATYKWLKNGVAQTGNADTFSFTPAHDDSITCEMTAPYSGCYLSLNAVSNHIKFEVTTPDTPRVDIIVTTNPVPCVGVTDTFVATANIPGVTYLWMVNGAALGANDDTFSYQPANGDIVRCIITVPAAGCFSKQQDTSNTLTLVVTPKTVPSISISGVGLALPGANVALTATLNNAGSTYSINWKNNGSSFATTVVPNVSYVKAAGTDNITAVITPVGCYDTALSNIHIVQEDVGISNTGLANGISVYPNPLADVLHVSGLKTGDALTVKDMAGKRMPYSLSVLRDMPQYEINVAGLAPGIYIIEVTGKDGNSKGNIKMEKL